MKSEYYPRLLEAVTIVGSERCSCHCNAGNKEFHVQFLSTPSSALRLMDYLDFEITVAENLNGGYTLTAHWGNSRVTEAFTFPVNATLLENHLSKIQIAVLSRSVTMRRSLSDAERTIQVLGNSLFNALFVPTVLDLYRAIRHQATLEEKYGVRLKLDIQSPLLAALPWEYLYHPDDQEFIGLSLRSPIVRTFPVNHAPPILLPRPLRILGMIANPYDQSLLDVEGEKSRLESALAPLGNQVQLKWVPKGTLPDLKEELENSHWHIFHYIGHGGFDRQRDEGFLSLEDTNGKTKPAYATQLYLLFQRAQGLQLAVLNSCDSARHSYHDLISAPAMALVRLGLPAVLAMQFAIPDNVAKTLTGYFYSALAKGSLLEHALADARQSLTLEDIDALEWGVPVLYIRSNRTPTSSTSLELAYHASSLDINSKSETLIIPSSKLLDISYLNEMGQNFIVANMLEKAKAVLTLSIKLSNNSEALTMLGAISELGGEIQEAIDFYNDALKLDNENIKYHHKLAILYIKYNKWNEGLQILNLAKQIRPNDVETDYLLAIVYEQSSNQSTLDKSIEHIKIALESAPKEFRYLRKLADLYSKQESWEVAQQVYQELVLFEPRDQSLLLALGQSAFHLRFYQQSIQSFRSAVLLNPFDLEANRLLAQSIALHFRPVLLAQLAQAELPLAGDFNALVAEGLDAAQRAYDYSGGDHASTDVLAHLYLLKQEPETAFALLQRTDPALFGRALFGELDGIVLLAVGESARAVEAFQHAARVHKESPLLWLAYSVASNEMGDLEEALHFAKDAAALAPDEGIYIYALAHLTMLANDPRRARKLLAQAISLRGNIPAWHRHLGQLAAAAMQYDAAHTAFTTALTMVEKHTPDDRGEEGLILRARAQVFQQENNLNGAIAELRRAIECFPNDPIWYQELAVLLQNVGDYGDAEQQYRSARKLQPDNADIALALAHTLEISNKPADALVELEAATAKWNNHVPAWCQLGRVRLTLKQNDAAHQAFQTALRLDPVEPLALLGMAQYHSFRDQREDERSYILKAYEVAPENADVLTQMGRLYMEIGNDAETRAEAANFFHAALQKDVSHLYAHVYLASLYNGEGQTPLALHHYQIAADLSPMSGWVWSALAECYAQQPNYKAAVDCYERAIYCDPENGEHHFNLGSLHYKNHRFEECLPAYRKADKLKFRRDKCNIYMMQARAKLAMGTPKNIRDMQRKFLDAEHRKEWNKIIAYGEILLEEGYNSNDIALKIANAYAKQALVFFKNKDFVNSLSYYHHAIKYDLRNPLFYFERGKVYHNAATIGHKVANYTMAVIDFSEAINLDDNNYLYFDARAITYREAFRKKDKVGDLNKAYIDNSKAIELNPDNGWHFYSRGLTNQMLGKRIEAAHDFAKAKELGYIA
jgi:tetratricopeptide (TPR) repeat protein